MSELKTGNWNCVDVEFENELFVKYRYREGIRQGFTSKSSKPEGIK